MSRPVPSTALAVLLLNACGGGDSGPEAGPVADTCPDSLPSQQSAFVLPYTVSESYFVSQANCSGFGHSGFWKYGYDFNMDIGTVVTAARAGTVLHVQDGADDGDRNRTNLITVGHDDGSVALYSHLTLNGVLVMVGQTVSAGDTIGLSGDTGNTGDIPHLHFSLHPCGALPGLPGSGDCPSIFANFRNTDENNTGLQRGRSYEAMPFN